MKHRRFQLTSNLPPTRRELTRTWVCSNFKPYRERKLEIFPTSFSLYRVWVPLYMLLPRRGPVSGFAKVAAFVPGAARKWGAATYALKKDRHCRRA
jgi:hypothetical protein